MEIEVTCEIFTSDILIEHEIDEELLCLKADSLILFANFTLHLYCWLPASVPSAFYVLNHLTTGFFF